MSNHDMIVIGASAGGVEVLLNLVPKLPADLPASIFVALHTQPERKSLLPELLSQRGPLPASHPLHQEQVLPGHIYIAPPDNHLLLREGSMEVVRGAKENGHRPAVDALFRTAAKSYGARVIGVVLSGYQDCGTAGMLSIKARGGVSVVQTPETAQAPEMPSSVIERVPVDYAVNPVDLPELLIRLTATPSARTAEPDVVIRQLEGDQLGEPARVVCPICQGVLTEAHAGRFEHFRCHVGHAFSLESLVREQSEELERAMWAAARALEESSTLSLRLSASERSDLRVRFAEKAKTQSQQADLIRQMLLHGLLLSRDDAAKL
jgi:two-component system chemotaxis response regulator CheB